MATWYVHSRSTRIPRARLPEVSDIVIERRRHGRLYDRHQSDETCPDCESIAARESMARFTLENWMEEGWTI